MTTSFSDDYIWQRNLSCRKAQIILNWFLEHGNDSNDLAWPQSNRAPFECGGNWNVHHGCAADTLDSSFRTAENSDQNYAPADWPADRLSCINALRPQCPNTLDWAPRQQASPHPHFLVIQLSAESLDVCRVRASVPQKHSAGWKDHPHSLTYWLTTAETQHFREMWLKPSTGFLFFFLLMWPCRTLITVQLNRVILNFWIHFFISRNLLIYFIQICRPAVIFKNKKLQQVGQLKRYWWDYSKQLCWLD